MREGETYLPLFRPLCSILVEVIAYGALSTVSINVDSHDHISHERQECIKVWQQQSVLGRIQDGNGTLCYSHRTSCYNGKGIHACSFAVRQMMIVVRRGICYSFCSE
jgi:hypothetical protein